MKPPRKLPRKVDNKTYAFRYMLAREVSHFVRRADADQAAQIWFWQGFTAGAREQAALAPHTPWTDTEINAYYARTRGY